MSAGQQFVDALDAVPENHRMENCTECRKLDERDREPCVLEGSAWCEHGCHWEKRQGPGYVTDSVIEMCPREKVRRAGIVAERAHELESERALRIASEAAAEQRILDRAEAIMAKRTIARR